MGWSDHFVSKRRNHFIIPIDNGWHRPLDEDALDNQSHLFHGVIHCNGYDHSLSVHGIVGGSEVLSGREMFCTNFRARKIAEEDLSRRGSMDLRSLIPYKIQVIENT
ncbi:PHD finger protein MALE MEIOCYTE DEATH 1 [Spatholobus suberectus]|nr:PHD finger protein MALE MEIOCYTE DEATH 1 [Spatholobus suberectus]